jgi:hypothetical protein
MGRPLMLPENRRIAFKVRAQQKIVDELTREAMEDDTTRQDVIEKILVAHVTTRVAGRDRAERKPDKAASRRPARRAKSARRPARRA